MHHVPRILIALLTTTLLATVPALAERVRLNIIEAERAAEAFTNGRSILVTLDPESASLLTEVANNNIGGQITVYLDGEVILQPHIQTRLATPLNRFEINVPFSANPKQLAQRLRGADAVLELDVPEKAPK